MHVLNATYVHTFLRYLFDSWVAIGMLKKYNKTLVIADKMGKKSWVKCHPGQQRTQSFYELFIFTFITGASHKHHDVPYHRQLDCVFNNLFILTTKKTPRLYITHICYGNPPVTDRFPPQSICNNAENFCMPWRHDSSWIKRYEGPEIF